MKILAIIPARGGSKGVPRKNVKVLGKKPLIAYSIDTALESTSLSRIVVSTEDQEIADCAKEYGAEIPFLRPEHLATDTVPTLLVLQHLIEKLEEEDEFYDAICLLQPTSPFREKGFVDKAILNFISAKTDSLVSVLEVPHEFNPHWVFEPNDKGYLNISTGEKQIISRRQELPKAYHRDGSIYLTKVDIIKQGSLYGDSITYIESNRESHVNIDTMSDWEEAERKYKKIVKK